MAISISMPVIAIPAQTAEQLKLLAAAAAFSYVGSTFASDITHTLRQTKPGRRAMRWVYQHPTASRCLFLTGTGALIIAWPSTVAKLLSLVSGIGATKESGSSFSASYRGGTTGFLGILQNAAAGRAPGVARVRQVGYAVTALSGAGAALALVQWRRLRAWFSSLRNRLFSGRKGDSSSSSSKESSSRKSSSKSKEERKDKERESSTHHYSMPSFPSSSSSSAAAAAAAAAATTPLPPPPPIPSSSRSGGYGGVTSPPPSEFEDHTDAESIYSQKSKKGHRSSRDKKERKEKDRDRKHRK